VFVVCHRGAQRLSAAARQGLGEARARAGAKHREMVDALAARDAAAAAEARMAAQLRDAQAAQAAADAAAAAAQSAAGEAREVAEAAAHDAATARLEAEASMMEGLENTVSAMERAERAEVRRPLARSLARHLLVLSWCFC
jgi:hypothetical protein